MQKRLLFLGAILAVSSAASAQPQNKSVGRLETVAQFNGPMPTGVTVSRTGRIFVNFPRWGDDVPFTVAEIKNGKAVAFPPNYITGWGPNSGSRRPLLTRGNSRRLQNWNDFASNGTRAVVSQEKSPSAQAERQRSFVGVQSVVVDALDRLWVLDTGSIGFGPVAMGGPKLVCIDLKTNRAIRTIFLSLQAGEIRANSYLNDVRFDLKNQVAYVTDSGAGAIIVVNLKTGRSLRRLENHSSVMPEPRFVPFIEGRALFSTPPGKFPGYLGISSDGIALSPDGEFLYYCPLASRRLYRVSTVALRESEAAARASVIDLGDKGMADGLESDAQGRIYITSVEQNAITRRLPNGLFETLVHSPKLLWPDTLSLAPNGDLFVIANQLHRQKGFNYGKDLREKPYSLFKIRTNGTPVALK